jgi:hypothetical protein
MRRRLGERRQPPPNEASVEHRVAATVVLRGHEMRLRFAADDRADVVPVTPSAPP